MSRPTTEDRGLAAVARVRSVRETDSRIGLQQVLADEMVVAARLATLENQVANISAPAVATPGDFVAHGYQLVQLGTLLQDARADVDTAAVVSTDARARWGSDRARLAAVEHLLEQRAVRRRTEAARRADREADDIAAQRWLRANHGDGA